MNQSEMDCWLGFLCRGAEYQSTEESLMNKSLIRYSSLIWAMNKYLLTLQHTATHCNTLQHTATSLSFMTWYAHESPHTATHCNTLQHTAAHCNTLQQSFIHDMICTWVSHISDMIFISDMSDEMISPYSLMTPYEHASLTPHQKLLGHGFLTPVPLFSLICTIISNKTGIFD